MRFVRSLVVIAAAVALGGCGKKVSPPVAPAATPARLPPAPTPQPAPETAPALDEYQRLKRLLPDEIDRMGLLVDIGFDFDASEVREADRPALSRNAEALKKFDFLLVAVEGHCDERGTVEYNLALGERRSRSAHEYLGSLGIPASRLRTVSYGKEAPLCRDSTEACWARNRRVHFKVTGKTGDR